MERKLPEKNIDGSIFIIDVAYMELRHKEDLLRTIPFGKMDNDGYEYFLEYDRLKKTIADENTIDENKLIVRLDQMVEIDPEAIAIKFNMVGEFLPEADQDFTCDMGLYEKRLAGQLPAIDVYGDIYTIHWLTRELIRKEYPNTHIDLAGGDMMKTDSGWLCFYDTITKEVVPVPTELTTMPEHVKMVIIPHQLHLDCVAVAMENGIETDYFIHNYPVQEKIAARVFPISQSILEMRMEQKQRQQKEELNSEKHQRRRGKRIH
jgi:hypothetical protein